ncbi:hypothetical protein DYB32_004435 [Aphanomyces invadans]|nr:hypothetical protein DYB32_004435 [Aphanomyces invadans]
MFSPYKRRKLQKQKATQDADLAKLKHAAQYFDLIDSVKLETTSAKAGDDGKSVDVDSKVDASSSATSTPATTPVKQQPQADTVRGSS